MQSPETQVDAPDLVVENFSFKRRIDDRDWNVTAVSAEHLHGVVSVADIAVSIDEPSASRRAEFVATSGDLVRESSFMSLYDVHGVAKSRSKDADIDATQANYDSERNIWVFGGGVDISTDEALFNGAAASIDKDGMIYFEGGVVTEWKEE